VSAVLERCYEVSAHVDAWLDYWLGNAERPSKPAWISKTDWERMRRMTHSIVLTIGN